MWTRYKVCTTSEEQLPVERWLHKDAAVARGSEPDVLGVEGLDVGALR